MQGAKHGERPSASYIARTTDGQDVWKQLGLVVQERAARPQRPGTSALYRARRGALRA